MSNPYLIIVAQHHCFAFFQKLPIIHRSVFTLKIRKTMDETSVGVFFNFNPKMIPADQLIRCFDANRCIRHRRFPPYHIKAFAQMEYLFLCIFIIKYGQLSPLRL